jgi:uncharacterized membrane protein YtjA (UPF0391 family)
VPVFETSRKTSTIITISRYCKYYWIQSKKNNGTVFSQLIIEEKYLLTFKLRLMLRWTVTFLIIAIIAAVFGFGGIAAGAASIAKILFFVFIVLFLISLIFGRSAKGTGV